MGKTPKNRQGSTSNRSNIQVRHRTEVCSRDRQHSCFGFNLVIFGIGLRKCQKMRCVAGALCYWGLHVEQQRGVVLVLCPLLLRHSTKGEGARRSLRVPTLIARFLSLYIIDCL